MKYFYKIKSRIWIEGANGTYLAQGRIELLKKIVEFGSISKAAKEMKMSYRKAWEQIDAINKEAREPIVIRVKGGKGGGGTEVTDRGLKAIKTFEKLNKKCENFLEKELLKLDL